MLMSYPASLLLQVSHWFFLSRLIQANAKMTIVMSSITASRAMINDSEPTNTEELGAIEGVDTDSGVNDMVCIKEVGVT